MRILLTGGAGFQGSHIAKKWLSDGHKVTILNTYSQEAEENVSSFRKDVSLVWGSITDMEIVSKTIRGHDAVVHLAAHINVDESLNNPRAFLDVNAGGTLNLLEAVRHSGVRMIHASTCEVYGYAGDILIDESSEIKPHSPYAASKLAAERMCFAYHTSYGVDVTIVRPSNVYGERQKTGRGGAVIPIFATLASQKKPLTVFGDGSQTREYIHVEDLISAYDMILRRSDLSGVTLNVGTGETPSIREIAVFISKKMDVPVQYGPARPGEVPGFALDSSKVKQMGFVPKIKFWDGLARYLESV